MTDPATPAPPELTDVTRSAGSAIARDHPTLLLTLIYLGLTFVGMLHDLWFYFYFRINVLDFSDTSDFLMAAIRNPAVILLGILPVGILLTFKRVRDTAMRTSQRYERYAKRYENAMWNALPFRILIYSCFIVVYAAVFTQLYAQWESNRVKSGKGRRVAFMRTDGIVSDEQPVLLGTTAKFLFLYYPSRKATEIVPIDNASVLTVDSRRRKEREADSLQRADTTIRLRAPQDSERDSENPD